MRLEVVLQGTVSPIGFRVYRGEPEKWIGDVVVTQTSVDRPNMRSRWEARGYPTSNGAACGFQEGTQYRFDLDDEQVAVSRNGFQSLVEANVYKWLLGILPSEERDPGPITGAIDRVEKDRDRRSQVYWINLYYRGSKIGDLELDVRDSPANLDTVLRWRFSPNTFGEVDLGMRSRGGTILKALGPSWVDSENQLWLETTIRELIRKEIEPQVKGALEVGLKPGGGIVEKLPLADPILRSMVDFLTQPNNPFPPPARKVEPQKKPQDGRVIPPETRRRFRT